ncbi:MULTISPECIES: asparagine synthetase B [Flectobacillus]|uniref:Asparagine synthetase B n=2 Tax=Flectobacillus TaxID=101 RepID=A0ABT6YZA0_9BACT|nr:MULTISPECIES: asparagine synthetase B [Flectobacillus]MDI9857655.1 asparagine synthetase B [Flectobacillus roseus]MDI9871097.1 asparagine synthetase B [Flectobacillus roseus]MDI9874163.1 asparagine synthetase B [Flectobacillus rivi]NBA75212.1 asparagine synthetase B [Emticicia sp. ODNR4P]
MKRLIFPFIIFFLFCTRAWASYILIPMDDTQKNHLKAYGLAYWVLKNHETEVEWLLNYRGGAFMVQQAQKFENELVIRGISYEVISDGDAAQIRTELSSPDVNMDVVKLQKPPKVAVYSPKTAQPWDDAVTLAMTYAEIPYDLIFDEDVLNNKLPEYDWLHLHHEDFTGQMGKFWNQSSQPWYQAQLREDKKNAAKYGFNKVSQLKLGVVKKIRDFVAGGGYMFAMCTATDTYDIALAAEGLDIVDAFYDGDGYDPNADKKLNYANSFAFQNFGLVYHPQVIEFSTIEAYPNNERPVREDNDYFNLFQFSAKWDPIPTMLTQNHETTIHGFMGQTTSYKKSLIKPEVTILGENRSLNEARYIHGTFLKGFWTFYGGHDPEDYQHFVNEEPTDLNLHPNSAGYRLILNNVLFPAAKKKKQKT